MLAEVEMTRADIRSGYQNAVIGSVAGVGLYAAVIVANGAAVGRWPVRFGPGLTLIGVSFALMGAAAAMMMSSTRINRRTQEAMGFDPDARRRISSVVLRGGSDALSDEEQSRAARFAAIMTRSLTFQTAQSVTVFAGLILCQVSVTFFPPPGLEPHHWPSVLLLAAMVTMLAITLRGRLRARYRAKRWAAMHASC
jgi:hypothetical protein